jgi:hypothetical protein
MKNLISCHPERSEGFLLTGNQQGRQGGRLGPPRLAGTEARPTFAFLKIYLGTPYFSYLMQKGDDYWPQIFHFTSVTRNHIYRFSILNYKDCQEKF